jgi:hypothetical protein
MAFWISARRSCPRGSSERRWSLVIAVNAASILRIRLRYLLGSIPTHLPASYTGFRNLPGTGEVQGTRGRSEPKCTWWVRGRGRSEEPFAGCGQAQDEPHRRGGALSPRRKSGRVLRPRRAFCRRRRCGAASRSHSRGGSSGRGPLQGLARRVRGARRSGRAFR